MNFKNNKGITGVDLSVALIIIVLFVGIISSLVYNFATSSRNINRKATATDIAIYKIENLKQDFINNNGVTEPDDNNNTLVEYAELKDAGNIEFYDSSTDAYKTPYKVETKITKFAHYNESSYVQGLSIEDKNRILQENLLKIVEVTVSYRSGNKEENVQIKTAITRED